MRSEKVFPLLVLAIVVLFALNILVGSIHIPAATVASILLGDADVKPSWQYIVIEAATGHNGDTGRCGPGRQWTHAADGIPQSAGRPQHFRH